jgi:DNA-binding IclR family transcriptional regulator
VSRSGSPPTDRVVRAVELLASHPTQPFSLAQIARQLQMNKATCLAVLTELSRAGWLVRDPVDKTYLLGATFLNLGRAALRAVPELQHARIALKRLTDERNLPCVIVALEGDDLSILDCAGDPSLLDPSNRPGARFPFVPPFGISFVAWGDPDTVEAWYARSDRPVTGEDRAWFEKVFDSVRERGYGVERLNEPILRIRHLLAEVATDPLAQRVQPAVLSLIHELGYHAQVVDELRAGERFPVNVVYVPVFDASARPVLNLSLHLVRDDMAYEEVDALAAELREVARTATLDSGGRIPGD